MDTIKLNAAVPFVMLDAARMRVSDRVRASFGDLPLTGDAGDICTDAFTNPGLYAWSPPS